MRDDRIAEWLLSLVTPPTRARSTVGDLLEGAASRGRCWFWLCVVRTAVALLRASLHAAPFRMAVFAAVGWFVYMLVCVAQLLCGWLLVTLLWGLGYFLTHHTGAELLADLLRIRIGWPPPPPSVTHWLEIFVVGIVAPLHVGRLASRSWPGREITAWVVVLLVWPLMATVVPFVAVSARVSLHWVPVIQTFVLLAALWERRVSQHASQHASQLTPR